MLAFFKKWNAFVINLSKNKINQNKKISQKLNLKKLTI